MLAMSMKVGKLPVVKPFNLCMVVVGGSATNLEKSNKVTKRYFVFVTFGQAAKNAEKEHEKEVMMMRGSLEKLAVGKTRRGVRF